LQHFHFLYANHPHWISWEPNWRDQDGAQQDWHCSQWWYNQNPNWVPISHPNSISGHPNWVNHSEPLDHWVVTQTENEGSQRNSPAAGLDSAESDESAESRSESSCDLRFPVGIA
jgi:hypothetical protein